MALPVIGDFRFGICDWRLTARGAGPRPMADQESKSKTQQPHNPSNRRTRSSTSASVCWLTRPHRTARRSLETWFIAHHSPWFPTVPSLAGVTPIANQESKTENATSSARWRRLALTGQVVADGLDLPGQTGRIAFDDVPNFLHVHPVIGVNEDIAKPGDLPPRNMGILDGEFRGQSLGRLADDLEIPNHRLLSSVSMTDFLDRTSVRPPVACWLLVSPTVPCGLGLLVLSCKHPSSDVTADN